MVKQLTLVVDIDEDIGDPQFLAEALEDFLLAGYAGAILNIDYCIDKVKNDG